jgi:hypothetical protein
MSASLVHLAMTTSLFIRGAAAERREPLRPVLGDRLVPRLSRSRWGRNTLVHEEDLSSIIIRVQTIDIASVGQRSTKRNHDWHGHVNDPSSSMMKLSRDWIQARFFYQINRLNGRFIASRPRA